MASKGVVKLHRTVNDLISNVKTIMNRLFTLPFVIKFHMDKRLPVFLFFSFFVINSDSQPASVTLSIKPDSSITSGMVTFQCTITNPTNNKYRYFDFDPTCIKRRYSPEFWKIVIRKGTTEYFDISLEFVLRHRIDDPDVKLYKNSLRTFNFCLNFSKLYIGSELSDVRHNEPMTDTGSFIKDYINESYGNYEVQISYLKDPFDPKNPLSLISNWANVEYVHD